MSSRDKILQKATIKRMKRADLWEQVRQSKNTIKKEGIISSVILSLLILCCIGALIYFGESILIAVFIGLMALIFVLSFSLGIALLKMLSKLHKIDKELKNAGVIYKELKKEFTAKK